MLAASRLPLRTTPARALLRGAVVFCLSVAAGAGSSDSRDLSSDQPGVPSSVTAALAGSVSDSDGRPVAAARLRVEPGGHAALADGQGRFSLVGLLPGEARVEITPPVRQLAAGAAVVRLRAGETHEVDFVLERLDTGNVSESIVVTGSGAEARLRDAPVRTELISSALVDRQVKTTLAEALTATLPGVRIENNCQNCGTNQVRINGLEGGYTQILENGLPAYSGVTSIYGLEQIPTAFVEQLEVVKGGNSALYGPNAVAGVINIISREPRERFFRLDSQTGWHRGRPETQYGAAAQLVEMPGGFSADLFYRGIQRTQIDRDHDGFTELPRRNMQAGGANLYKRFFDGAAQLRLSGGTVHEFRRGGSQLDLRPEETFITEQVISDRHAAALRWNHSVSPNTYYNLAGSLSYLGRSSYYGADFDPNAYGATRNPLWVSDAQVGHIRGRHTLIGGYQYWREFVADAIPAYNRSFSDLFTNQGVYLQDEIRIAPQVVVIGGFRADRSNVVDHWIFSPRGALKLGLTEYLTWRVGVSTGFRPPVIFDEDLHVATAGGEGLLVERSAGLREERSLSFTTGLDYLGMIGGRRFQLGANLFHTRLRDNHQLQETEVDGFRKLLRVNGAGSYVRGVDLSANVDITRSISFRSGMTFQLARFEDPEPQFGSLRFFRAPNRYGFAGLDLDLPRNWEITATGDYTGSMLAPHYAGFIAEDRLETTPSFFVPSLLVSKLTQPREGMKVRWYFSARNLSDTFQRDLDQGPLRDATYLYGPTQMRQLTIGTTIEF